MKDYVILTDSCADLSLELATNHSIGVIPMEFTLDGKSYKNYIDQREMSIKDFYDKMRKGSMGKTSQITPQMYLDFLTPYLDKGLDILYICFTSGMSGTCSSAFTARQLLMEKAKYANQKLIVIDSLCACGGEGFLVLHAAFNKEKGMSLEENAKWVETHKLNVAHWFTVTDLNTLKRGGRLSATKAFLGNLLSLKPILHVSNEGTIVPVDTVRGRKQALIYIMDRYEKTALDTKGLILISHGDDLATAQLLGQAINEKFGEREILYTQIGPTIGTHTGPGAITFFFMAKER
jgi:DegV family protein with EDD domain